MSTLKTNTISTNDANNVALSNQLNLKSYTTTNRDALTSVAGDMIYNTTTSKAEFYNGSAWVEAGGIDAFDIEYVIVGGGASGGSIYGSGNMGAGGGGAGGYVSSVIGENTGGGLSSHQVMYIAPSTNYPVSIGAGGAAESSGSVQANGYCGTASYFNNIVANGGGAAGSYGYNQQQGREIKGGSGGGKGTRINVSFSSGVGGSGLVGQGYAGGDAQGAHSAGSNNATGGGGGASAVGADGGSDNGGNGGAGVATSISGSSVTYAGGGGGSGASSVGTGGAGGGADGIKNNNGNSGTANTGGGAGGLYNTSGVTSQRYGGNGGSGVVILRYPNDYTISQSGLTLTTATDGSDKVTTITAGTGTVSFA